MCRRARRGRSQTEFIGQKKQLGIEPPALNLLASEDGLDSTAIEGLEPALGIFVFQPQHQTKANVEQSAEELTQKRLALGLKFAL